MGSIFAEQLNQLDSRLLGTPISELKLGVRAQNFLKNEKVFVVADLVKVTPATVHAASNMGKKSLDQITDAIKHLANQHPPNREQDAGDPMLFDIDDVLSVTTPRHSLIDRVREAVSALPEKREREARILEARFGLKGQHETLDAIATKESVTRQRIEQIEKRAVQSVLDCGGIRAAVVEHLRIFEARKEPMYLATLSAADPFFENIDDYPELLRLLLKGIGSSMYVVDLDADEKSNAAKGEFISHRKKDECVKALKAARAALRKSGVVEVAGGDSRRAIKQIVEPLFEDDTALVEVICELLSEEVIDRPIGSDGGRVVYSRNTAVNVVFAILTESPEPLDRAVIADRAVAFGARAGRPSIYNVCKDVGWLFSRGTYGLEKHCPLNNDELSALAERCELFLATDSQRQFTCQELLDHIRTEPRWHVDERLTKYMIEMALDLHAISSTSLKRQVWQSTGRRLEANSAQRRQIGDLIARALAEAGRALTTAELRRYVEQVRGLQEMFQVQAREDIVRVGRALWNLKSRVAPGDVVGSNTA